MPYYDTRLLSAYTNDLIPSLPGALPPPKIPADVLNSMKMTAFVGYAQTPPDLKGKRNMVAKQGKTQDQGRFISEASRRQEEEDEVRLLIPRR